MGNKKMFPLKLTEEERKKLDCDAKRCGLAKNTYLVRLIMDTDIKAAPCAELRELRAEINRIGVNINQIAHAVNARIAKREDIDELLFLMKRIYELMYYMGEER